MLKEVRFCEQSWHPESSHFSHLQLISEDYVVETTAANDVSVLCQQFVEQIIKCQVSVSIQKSEHNVHSFVIHQVWRTTLLFIMCVAAVDVSVLRQL